MLPLTSNRIISASTTALPCVPSDGRDLTCATIARANKSSYFRTVEGVTYVKPFYSNSQVDKAADRLIDAIRGSDAYKAELKIINQWRSSHLWPLGKVRQTLSNRSIRVDRNALTVQRLKRLSSIENKLIRLAGTRLSGMQDIGGCRSIVQDVDCVNRIVGLYEDARDRTRVDRSALISDPRDYIQQPQPTGYRGVHLIIKYQSTGTETEMWTGRKIEIQLRTKLQHSWATTLESMSTFLGQQLKANLGDPQWLRLFALASGVFAAREECPPVPGLPVGDALYQETYKLWKELNVRSVLHGCTVMGSPEHDFHETPGMSFYVLKLDATDRQTVVWAFDKNQVVQAGDWYNEQEAEYSTRPDVDIVLVSANDMLDLRAAYPNYWADTSDFSRILQDELELKLGVEL